MTRMTRTCMTDDQIIKQILFTEMRSKIPLSRSRTRLRNSVIKILQEGTQIDMA